MSGRETIAAEGGHSLACGGEVGGVDAAVDEERSGNGAVRGKGDVGARGRPYGLRWRAGPRAFGGVKWRACPDSWLCCLGMVARAFGGRESGVI